VPKKGANRRNWLAATRVSKGLDQKDVATRANEILIKRYPNDENMRLSTNAISKYELGRMTPTEERAKAVAEVLGFNWIRFKGGEERKGGIG